MTATTNARLMLHWAALAMLLATGFALGAAPAVAGDRHHRHWNYDDHYGDDQGEDDDEDDDGGYYRYDEPPRVVYEERRYYAPAPTYYYPPPVYYYPRPRYYGEPSFSFGVTLPIH